MTLVNDIVKQLKRGGPLRDPWAQRPDCAEHPYAGMPIDDVVRIEVQRAIQGVRNRRDCYPNLDEEARKKIRDMQSRSAADYHKLGRQVRKMGMTTVIDFGDFEAPIDFETLGQEPPPHAWEPLKYYCADEAFFLMEMFSAAPPTSSEGDYPFQMITQKLYRYLKPGGNDNVERACDWILNKRRDRRKHRWPDFPDA
jgi:hypothetical protein